MAKGPSTSERARRVIALLGQLAPDTRISIADLAAEVGASQAQLAADLETLAMCGVAPYDPGDLMPLLIEDGMVEVWGELPAVRGPVRLSAAEARALAAASTLPTSSAPFEPPHRHTRPRCSSRSPKRWTAAVS